MDHDGSADDLCLAPLLRFSDKHGFRKPNDDRALKLMDKAAQSLMDEYPDVVLGFGESDEYSWVSCLSLSSQLRS